MEEHASVLTQFVNRLLAPVALYILHALGMQPESYETPIPEYVVMSLVVLIVGTILVLILRPRLSVERPGALQQIAEGLLTNRLGFGIKDVLESNVGQGAEKFIAFTGSVSVFILLANLLGLIPAFTSPTGGWPPVVPLACASLTFLYFNWQGARRHGLGGYILTFAGSPKSFGDWLLAVLLFPVEIVSTLARILSLTVRLGANILASDLIYGIFLGLLVQPYAWAAEKSAILAVPFGILTALVPLVFIGLHIFVSIIQTYIFTILPSIYIGFAVSEGHGH